MENYLNWNDPDLNFKQEEQDNPKPNINLPPTSTINDQDLLDFSGLDQFINNNEQQDIQSKSLQTPQIIKEENDEDTLLPETYQPQSYRQSSSSYNNKMMSSSLSGVRRSLSKAMTNSRKSSIIKDEITTNSIKSPRSRKSSIVGTPSLPGSYIGGNSVGQTTSVERKRRDNINDKIQELLTIIPDTFFYENDKSTGTKDGKPNKGQILTKSVEYIQFLQNEIDSKNRKEVEFIYKLKKLNFDTSNFNHTSAEIGLGKIGVGPLSHLQREEVQRKWRNSQTNNVSKTPNSDFSNTDTPNDSVNTNQNTNNSNDNDNQDFLNF